MRATRAIIHLANLIDNINIVKKHLLNGNSKCKICMPVKANAYGHGAVEISKTALANGVDYLAVATVNEGAQLRDAGIKAPILLLSQCTPNEMQDAAYNELIPLVSDNEGAKLFAEASAKTLAKKGLVFLKIDTGMGRIGCAPQKAAELARYISSLDSIRLAGVITHFAVSDSAEPSDIAYTNNQLEKFNDAIAAIREVSCVIVSAANTGATIAHPAAWFDMVRPGILLYGYPPVGLQPQLSVKPVMELVSQIVFTKKIQKGDSVSYGRTWIAEKDTTIGIIPVGYADGLPRLLSNKFKVSIGNKLYPVIGRICMDQCMVEIDGNVQCWDTVSIFGGNCNGSFNAADIADQIGTIPYEITCNINKRVERVYQ
jgi:alanine racemase